MFHILFVTLLFSCVVNAWSGLWGFGRGSHGRGRPHPSPVAFKTITIEHLGNTQTLSSSPTTSQPPHTTQNSQGFKTITQSSIYTSSTSHSHSSSTATSSSTTSSSSSVFTNPNVRFNTFSTGSYVTPSPSAPSTSTSPQVQTTPSNTANPQSGLGLSKSHLPIVIGVSVVLVLLMLLLAGCLVFRARFRHSKVVFHSDHMVQNRVCGASVDAYPYLQPGPPTWNTSLISPAEGIPNPFASDLDYNYSTQSEISFNDSESEVITTLPGPASTSTHAYTN